MQEPAERIVEKPVWPWHPIAVGGLVVSVALAVAVVALVSVRQSDAFATLALALAALSFVIQIMVFVVQTNIANAQAVRAERLSSEMLSLVQELRVRTTSTQDLIQDQLGSVLQNFMSRVPGAMSNRGSGLVLHESGRPSAGSARLDRLTSRRCDVWRWSRLRLRSTRYTDG